MQLLVPTICPPDYPLELFHQNRPQIPKVKQPLSTTPSKLQESPYIQNQYKQNITYNIQMSEDHNHNPLQDQHQQPHLQGDPPPHNTQHSQQPNHIQPTNLQTHNPNNDPTTSQLHNQNQTNIPEEQNQNQEEPKENTQDINGPSEQEKNIQNDPNQGSNINQNLEDQGNSSQIAQNVIVDGVEMQLIPKQQYQALLQQNKDQPPQSISKYRRKIHKEEIVKKNEVDPKLMQWFKEKIESGISIYDHDHHWTSQAEESATKFLTSKETDKLFLSVENQKLQFKFNNPDYSQSKEYNQILVFLKMSSEDVTFNNVEDVIFVKKIQNNHLKSLLQLMHKTIIPELFKEKSWPDNVKKQFLSQLNKFMTSITQNCYAAEGYTQLYIPNQDLNNLDGQDKDIIQRLDAVVIDWNKQLREIINNADSKHQNQNSGPLDQIHYWRKRKQNLERIDTQLQKQQLINIVKFLIRVGSTYAKSFQQTIKSIKSKSEQANNNLLFLQSLYQPCKSLETVSPKQIPDLLPNLLMRVRMIWQHSIYYKSNQRISGLLHKISNQIIKRCKDQINVENMLDGDVEKCIQDLKDSITCGKRWRSIYDKMALTINKRSPVKWDFSSNSIFAQVEAFVQRCSQLIEICEGQLQFAMKGVNTQMPKFGGSRASEIVNILFEIKASFGKLIDKFRTSEKDKILDVKASTWHDEYNAFKSGMKELDVMYQNVIDYSFKQVTTVEQGVEMLEAFDYLAKRESIKICVRKKAAEILNLFISEVEAAKHENQQRRNVNYPLHHGKYSGQAIFVRSLSTRIQKLKQLIDKLHFVDDNLKQSAFQKYSIVYKNLDSVLRQQKLNSWKEENKVFDQISNLNRTVETTTILCRPDESNQDYKLQQILRPKPGHLQCNFDRKLMKLMTEVSAWKVLIPFNVIIPNDASQFTSDNQQYLRVLKQYSMIVVRDYNAIIDYMDPTEKKLFAEHLENTDKMIQPGTQRHKWNSKNNIQGFLGKSCKMSCAQLYNKLKIFKVSTEKMDLKCKQIASKMFININKKKPYYVSQFQQEQVNHRKDVVIKLKAIFEEIFSILKSTYDSFAAGRRETQLVWFSFVKEIDAKIEEALKKAVKNSLIELYKVIGDSQKNIQAIPIFILSVQLQRHDNAKLNYRPSFSSLIKTVKQTIQSMNQIFKEFKSMQQRMLVEYKSRKQELIAKSEKQKNPNKKIVQEQEIKVPEENYFQRIIRDGDIAKYASKIQLNLQKVCAQAMKDTSNNKWLNSNLLWESKRRQKYTEDIINQNWSSIDNIREIIQNLDIQNQQIQTIKSSLPIGCIVLDNSSFKQSLSEIIIIWQNSFLDCLRQKCIEELTHLHNVFKSSEGNLTPEPQNLQQLKASTQLWQYLTETKTQSYESKLEPLKDKLTELDGHSVQFKEQETKMRVTLLDAWRRFNEMLVEIQKRNQRVRSTFQYETTKSHQQFIKQTGDLKVQFMGNAPFQSNYKNQKANSILLQYKDTVNQLRKRWEDMKFGFDLFEINYSNPGDLDTVDKEILNLGNIWGLRQKWDRQYQNDIKSIGFKDVNVDKLEEVAQDYLEALSDFCKQNYMKKWDVVTAFKTSIENFSSVLPLIQALRQPSMRTRHWQELQKSLDFSPDSESFTFDQIFVQKNFLAYADTINNICEVARQQFKIESALSKIKTGWQNLELDMEVYKKSFKMKGTDAIFAILEDNMGTLSNQKTGIYYQSFKDQIQEWEQKLQQVSTTLDQLIQVQRQWIYLDGIFASQEQQDKQLVGDISKFQKLSSRVTIHMDRLGQKRNVIVGLIVPDFYEDLVDISRGLDQSQKILFSLLQRKRRDFPRFYFLANDDLFELLGNSKDPKRVNKHIKKCFEGIKKLTIISTQIPGRRNNDVFTHDVTQLISPEEQVVKLSQKIACENGVQNWIKACQKNMRETLKKLLYVTLNNYTKKKDSKAIGEWVQNHLGQLLIVASQIIWTNDCQAVLKSLGSSEKPDKSKHWKIIKQQKVSFLNQLTKLVRKTSKYVTRLKLVALITIQVHARDITQHLSKTCFSINSFEWKKQLRFGGQSQGDMFQCIVQQTSTRFPYGYQYQGNNGRLVVTALTDRCYMTLTTAMHLKKGGAPQGPAGTGKTETVKDLGKGMAKFVLVFNCSEGLDYKSLGRMFSGLMQTGGWGCFDEFNRIQLQVLSVVAQQMLCILNALKQLQATKDRHSPDNPYSFTFEQSNIPANDQCAIFITMNPGYAGRSELPDNLKSLFRPISMMVPESNIICQIMLSSQGFKYGKMLSTKMVVLYTLMAQQLSKQDHYDFGLRAIKSVLTCAGAIRKDAPIDPSLEKVDKKDKQLMKQLEEQQIKQQTIILMKAINDMNLPKFVTEDTPLFRSLFTDLFPGIQLPDLNNQQLVGAIKKQLENAKLIPNAEQIRKIIQLYDSKNTRHGNMLVGSSLSGKSTCWKILKNAMNSLNKQNPDKYPAVKHEVLNPKTIDLKQLFGYVDANLEWSEGVLSSMMSRLCKDESNDQRWMILDGPVDTFWIESMNTVLDDNKVLTLLNGDRISLPPQVGLVFEVQDLAVASPATVSRAGMIFLNISDLGWNYILQSWILKIKDEHVQQFITGTIEKWLPKLFAKKKSNKDSFKELVPVLDSHIVISFTKLMDAFVSTQSKTMAFNIPNKTEIYWNLLQKWMAFCLIWSFGATLDENGRKMFDGIFRDIQSMFPSNFTVFDYYINTEKNQWSSWQDKINAINWKPPANAPFHKLLVPTVESARNRYVLMNCVQNRIHTLSVGVTGTGKTVVINQILSQLDESIWKTTNIIFSSQTSSQKTQEVIQGKLTRRSKTKMVPDGKRMVIYVDDFNMPKKDTFGSQPPLQLIRQWMDYEGWFDRQQKQIFKRIEDIQFISSMGPPGGGRAQISRRILTKFNIINFTFPSDTQVRRIFQTILSYKFQIQQFQDEIKPLAETMSTATINLYQAVSETFLPTPAKSHYVFNMRDISKVIQGIYVFDKYYCDSKVTMLRLWVHEALRVFHDRLVSLDDRQKLKRLVSDQLQQTLSTNMKECTDQNQADTIFVDFYDQTQTRQIYIEVPYKQRQQLKRIVQEKLQQYNDKHKSSPMNIVLFDEALSYLCKVHRIIKFQKGHGMLVGEGGAGRKSITKLACFIAKYDLRQISASKNYKLKDFRQNIKQWSATCVYTDTPCVLMFSDNQITDQAFVEDINTILTIGEIPNLFSKQDYPTIKDKMRTLIARKNKQSKENLKDEYLLEQFFTRVQNNFHIIFLMSKTGDNLRNYCRMYPGLVNNTTLIWFMPWPADALVEVANRSLMKLPFDQQTRKNISTFFGNAHTQVMVLAQKMLNQLKRLYYVTPTNYIQLVKGYTELLHEKQQQIGSQIQKLSNGLFKLDEAQQNSNQLQKNLAILQIELAKKSKDCQELLIKIDRQTRDSKERKTQVEQREVLVNKQKSQMEILKVEAEEDLRKAQPALVAAEQGLANLTKDKISVVKSYAQPPAGVDTVLNAVMIFLNKQPNWAVAKKELADASFLNRLKDLKIKQVTTKTLLKIEKLTQDPRMTLQKIDSISEAAGGLWRWVLAVEGYAKAYKDIEPKRIRCANLEQKLKKSEDQLNNLRENFQKLKNILDNLTDSLNKAKQDMQGYQKQAQQLQVKLERADKLINGLASTKLGWQDRKKKLEEKYEYLIGDALMSAALLSYAGPFPSQYRESFVKNQLLGMVKTLKIPHSKDFNFPQFLIKPVQFIKWQLKGLPDDNFSKQNGVLVKKGRMFPLLIDPQQQGNKWIRDMEKQINKDKLFIIDPRTEGYTDIIKKAISFGNVIILQNLQEELDATLQPLLNKNIKKVGGVKSIYLGEEPVRYDDNFRFYMTTKLPNPKFKAEVTTKVTLINFTVKEKGLEEQLTSVVIRKIEAQLESNKNQLIKNKSQNQQIMKKLDDDILKILSTTKTNLIDDENIIVYLQQSKETEEKVRQQIETSATQMKKIYAARQNYKKLAKVASKLFFIINDFALIEPMYQFALDAYIFLFEKTIKEYIQKPGLNDSLQQKLQAIAERHKAAAYRYACRGLFEKDKLLLGLMMTVKLKDIDQVQYNFFLRGGADPNVDRKGQVLNQNEWIQQSNWNTICDLEKLPNFSGIIGAFTHNSRQWKRWYMSSEPEKQPLPGEWEEKCDSLRKMILIKIIRRDRVLPAAVNFIIQKNGSDTFVNPPNFSLDSVFNDSNKITPIIFILSPGVDPHSQLESYARTKGVQFLPVSLGQGQAKKAKQKVFEGAKNGTWLYLANCHLSLSFLKDLQKIMQTFQMNKQDVNQNFRLWLSTNPHPKFPISILQKCIKITTEPPKGLKANMLRLYSNLPKQLCPVSVINKVPYKRSLFSLCFFHSIIIQRRRFKTLGWNITYDFNDSDWQTADKILQQYIDETQETKITNTSVTGQQTVIVKTPPWDAIRYLIAEVTYGGRVTDQWDRRLLNVYAHEYFNQSVISEQKHPLGNPNSNQYVIPQELGPKQKNLEKDGEAKYYYKKIVEEFPPTEKPETFGQHINAQISSQIADTNAMLESISTLESTQMGGGEQTMENKVKEMIKDILSTISQQIDLEDVILKVKPYEDQNPLKIVLIQEISRYNKLLNTVRTSLINLQKGINGLVLISQDLEIIMKCLYDNKVPEKWKFAYHSLKPLSSWITDLNKRVDQFRNWAYKGQPNVFWISGFSFPTGFTTALQQQASRKFGVPIDQFTWEFAFQKMDTAITIPAKEGAYIQGLYLEGAKWDGDKNCITEPQPMKLYYKMPIIQIKPVSYEGKQKGRKGQNFYQCPTYMYPIRTGVRQKPSYLFTVQLPCKPNPNNTSQSEQDFWIKRGTALLLSLATEE